MYENEDFIVPLIWEGDGNNPSPHYNERYAEYGVQALPSSPINGDTFDIGGGGAVLSRYQAIYNSLINVSSPLELDVNMSITAGGQIEITADALVTETIAADDYRIILLLTNYYTDSYHSSVTRYYEEDFNLTSIGSTEQFIHEFTSDPSWDIAQVRAVALVQTVNTTGTFTVSGYTFNMYPILQAGLATYPLVAVEPIADTIVEFNEIVEFDVTNYFQYQGTPVDIDLTVESSDESIATVSLVDDIMTITAMQTIGSTQITISGEYDGYFASDVFELSVIDPATIHVIFHLYDSYGDGWNYSGSENYIEIGEHYITLEDGGEGQYDLFLLPGEHPYTYTATDSWGSENSWTVNLEDGTELGAGQGGANGTYDYTFTLEGPDTGTVEGLITLSNTGELTSVEISAGGIITNPDIDGDYVLTLPVGTYDVTASLEGYDTETIIDVVVTEGNATTGIDFNLLTEGDDIIIVATKLGYNYPNPFNPTTNIAYSIKEAGIVTLEVYNLRGQLVKTLVNDVQEAGNFTTAWSGKDNSNKPVSSGVYFYKMKSGNYTSTKKMILMK